MKAQASSYDLSESDLLLQALVYCYDFSKAERRSIPVVNIFNCNPTLYLCTVRDGGGEGLD